MRMTTSCAVQIDFPLVRRKPPIPIPSQTHSSIHEMRSLAMMVVLLAAAEPALCSPPDKGSYAVAMITHRNLTWLDASDQQLVASPLLLMFTRRVVACVAYYKQ